MTVNLWNAIMTLELVTVIACVFSNSDPPGQARQDWHELVVLR